MEPFEFVVVALGAFRLWRIAARDTITEKLREDVTGYDDDEAPGFDHDQVARAHGRRKLRLYLTGLIRCPWCLGFYVSVGAYLAWRWQPDVTLAVATVLAISAALGFLGKADHRLG